MLTWSGTIRTTKLTRLGCNGLPVCSNTRHRLFARKQQNCVRVLSPTDVLHNAGCHPCQQLESASAEEGLTKMRHGLHPDKNMCLAFFSSRLLRGGSGLHGVALFHALSYGILRYISINPQFGDKSKGNIAAQAIPPGSPQSIATKDRHKGSSSFLFFSFCLSFFIYLMHYFIRLY